MAQTVRRRDLAVERRTVHRREPTDPGPAPTRAVRRPRALLATGLVLLLSVLPSRGSPGLAGTMLAVGPTSPPALLLYAFWVLVLATGLLARVRCSTVLTARPGRSPVLVEQGLLTRRVLDLDGVAEVMLLRFARGSRSTAGLLLDASGRVRGRARVHTNFWLRDDVLHLLDDAGIAVRHERRRVTPAAAEARYPGATSRADRYGIGVLLALGLLAVAALLALVLTQR